MDLSVKSLELCFVVFFFLMQKKLQARDTSTCSEAKKLCSTLSASASSGYMFSVNLVKDL